MPVRFAIDTLRQTLADQRVGIICVSSDEILRTFSVSGCKCGEQVDPSLVREFRICHSRTASLKHPSLPSKVQDLVLEKPIKTTYKVCKQLPLHIVTVLSVSKLVEQHQALLWVSSCLLEQRGQG